MHDFYDPCADMDEATLHAWQFYLAVADLALGHLQTMPAGTIAITEDQENAYWAWQGADQMYLAWAPIADNMVCFDAAILLQETIGLTAEEINYRRESLTRWLQADLPTTLKWPRAELQQAIHAAGQF